MATSKEGAPWLDKELLTKTVLVVLSIAVVIAIVLFTLLLVGLVAAIKSMPELVAWFARHPRIAALSATLLAIFLGAAASYWKRKNWKSYSIMEIAFGAAVTLNVALSVGGYSSAKLIAICSAVYVIARGFNNLSDAFRPYRYPF
jgi:hypothetical protein